MTDTTATADRLRLVYHRQCRFCYHPRLLSTTRWTLCPHCRTSTELDDV